MNLIVALCVLCGWVAPQAWCRSVDTRDTPSEDLEPLLAHHHHEGNIAELLIPLLERSLAQSEARSNERQHRRSKAGKKVIQVLPYRGSEEHKRKGWRKLNSHKKQVVEITPLHGKNRAKPLAYILSAAKPSHGEHAETNDDVSSSNTSELEHDKSTSEEQQSSEENKEDSDDVHINTLRTGEGSESHSASAQSSEDGDSKESKDSNASDKESADETADATAESVADASAEKSEEKNVVVIEDSEEDSSVAPKAELHHNHHHEHEHELVSAEDKHATIEDEAVTAEDATVTVEDAEETAEDATVTAEDKEITAEDADVTSEDKATATEEAEATVENSDVTAENKAATVEDSVLSADDAGVSAESKAETAEDVEVTVEDETVTVEDVDVLVIDKAALPEEEPVKSEENTTTEENNAASDDAAVTAEDQQAVEDGETAEKDASVYTADGTLENADVTVENIVTVERAASVEESEEHATHSHPHHVENDVSAINGLISKIGRDATAENDDSGEHSRGGYIQDDIVISRARQETDSAEKSINKLFNARARDIIELIQSSVESSTAAQRDCLEPAEKHHDHKSYRLSFLFNK